MNLLRNKKVVAIFVVVIVFIIGLVFIGQNSNSQVIEGKVVKEDLIQRTTIAGIVIPARKTVILPPYSGYIKKIFVKVGDHVKPGDPLVSLVQSLQSPDNSFPIRSPLAGTVVKIEKSEGEFIQENDYGKNMILRIDDLSKLYVVANTPEIDRTKVKQDQETIVRATAIINKTYKGIIRELSLAAVEKTEWARSQVVEFPIKIELMEKDDEIKPGMSVIVDVITAKRDQVLTLRHEYIRHEKDQTFVTLKNGKKQNIKVGLQNEEAVEIIEGLNEGDLVQQVDFATLGESN